MRGGNLENSRDILGQTDSVPSESKVSSESSPARGLKVRVQLPEIVFLLLLAQIVALVLLSLVLQVGPTFVGRDPRGFCMDFFDLYLAGNFHAQHINPYLTGRFVTPPFSLLIGSSFQWLPFEQARYLWFLLNLGMVAAALAAFARQIGLGARNTLLLFMIAGVFYPLYFLLERGNIDGLVLACLVFAFRARHRAVTIVLYGMSIALKLYSGLLALVFARRKRWTLAVGGIVAAVVLQLPWLGLAMVYPRVLGQRSTQMIVTENISPANFFQFVFDFLGVPGWKIVFVLFWLLTLLWVLVQERPPEQDPADWVLFVPWMISMPSVVYPYSAVLTLPLLALLAKRSEHEKLGVPEWLLIVGFVLSGTQQNAWGELLSNLTTHVVWIYQLNSLGTALLVGGCCVLAARGSQVAKPMPANRATIGCPM